MQERQRFGQRPDIGAVERGDAKHHVYPVTVDVIGQRGPQVIDPDASAIVTVQARPPEFQQPAARGQKRRKVVFVFGIELTSLARLVLPQQAIDADNRVQARGAAFAVEQKKVVEEGVKAIGLTPGGMIDHRPVAAEFFDEDVIAQRLRQGDFAVGPGKADVKVGGKVGHQPSVGHGRAT